MTKTSFAKQRIICYFLFCYGTLLLSQVEENIEVLSKNLKGMSITNADEIFKKNAFPEFIGDSFSKGRSSIPIEENKNRIKTVSALFENQKLIKENKFKTYFLRYLKTSNSPPLTCFLITTFLRSNPDNVFFAKSFLSILVNKVQDSGKKDKWKYLYIIDQLLRNVCYNPKLDATIIQELDTLYPHTGFPMDKEMKKRLTDLYGKNAVNELKRTVPKKQEYDPNSYIQFTFILFSYVYLKKDELRKHIENNQGLLN